ncbi:MAG: DNA repair protein RecO [Candidatus Poribacteria bacterium]
MAVEKDTAIVVRSFAFKEADRIVTFLTPSFGKVAVVARGSRKARSRLSASLELFNIGQLVFFEKPNRTLHNVNSFDVSHPIGIRLRDHLAVAYASYLAQLASDVSLERDENPPLFYLLHAALLSVLDAGTVSDLRAIARCFEAKLLTLSGYRPRLDVCVACGEEVHEDEVAVGISIGGALCPDHAYQDRTLMVSAGGIAAVQGLTRQTFEAAMSASMTRREKIECKHLLTMFLAERLERRQRAAEYIDDLESSVDEATELVR